MKRQSRKILSMFLAFVIFLSQSDPALALTKNLKNEEIKENFNTTTSSISGRVTDLQNGSGISGVTIQAILDNYSVYIPALSSPSGNASPSNINPPTYFQNSYTTQTDSNGDYNFLGLPPGRYLILALKAGIDFNPLSYHAIVPSSGNQYDFTVTVVPTVYSASAIPLSDSTVANLASVSADGSVFTFSTNTSDLSQVNTGTIITGGVSGVSPEGFLRKVVSKQQQGNEVILTTQPAKLEEAFNSLSVNISKDLLSSDFQAVDQVPGVSLDRSPSSIRADGDPINYSISKYVVYDQDNNPATTNDQLTFDGFVSLKPHLETRIRIENGELKEYYQNYEMSVTTSTTVNSWFEKVSNTIAVEKTLLPVPLKQRFMAGPVEVSIGFDIFVGFSGSLTGSISSTTTNNTMSISKGYWYVNGEEKEWDKYTNSPSATPPVSQVAVSFKAYIGAKITLKFYEIVGFYIKANFGIKLDIVLDPAFKVNLKVGLELSGGFAIGIEEGIFRIIFLDVVLGSKEWWYLIYSYPDPTNNEPYLPANPSPPLNSTNQSLTAQMSWDGGDPNGDLVVYDVYLNAGTYPPVTKVADHQTQKTFNPGQLLEKTIYYWKIVAFDQHGVSMVGPVWSFSTIGYNQAPYTPGTPIPIIGAANQELALNLSWSGDDPDGDATTYDVYLNTGDVFPSSKVSSAQSAKTYNTGTLLGNTRYSWRVVAHDEHGLPAVGPVWQFTTKVPPTLPIAAGDHFGSSIALDGNRMIIGAPQDDTNGTNAGAVYVFDKNGSAWQFTTKLVGSDTRAGDLFGGSIALEGNNIVIGAAYHENTKTDEGAVYVFAYDGSAWAQQAEVVPGDPKTSNHFGQLVAISNTTLIASAADSNYGAVYAFVASGASWLQQAKLVAATRQLNHCYGCAIDIDNDTVVVGAIQDNSISQAGAVFIHVRSGTTWTQQAKLTVASPNGYYFGHDVAIIGDSVLAGARLYTYNANQSGAAFNLKRSGTTWSVQPPFYPADGQANDNFGFPIKMYADYAAIGAADDDRGTDAGAVYIYQLASGVYTMRQKITASDGTAGDQFMSAIGLGNGIVVIGAPYADAHGTDSGAVYIFELSNSTWSQTGKIY